MQHEGDLNIITVELETRPYSLSTIVSSNGKAFGPFKPCFLTESSSSIGWRQSLLGARAPNSSKFKN